MTGCGSGSAIIRISTVAFPHEHSHGREAGVLQQLAKGEFEVVHHLLSAVICLLIFGFRIRSFVSKRCHRIGTGRASRGEVTSEQRDDGEKRRHAGKCHWIGRLDTEKQCLQDLRQGNRGSGSQDQSDGDELQTLVEDQAKHLPPLSTDRHTDANLASSRTNRERQHAANPHQRQGAPDDGKAHQDRGAAWSR